MQEKQLKHTKSSQTALIIDACKCTNLRVMSSIKKNNESETEVRRISLSLSSQSADKVDYLTESQGITQNEAVRKSISTEYYIRRETEEGAKFFITKPDGRSLEVVFR